MTAAVRQRRARLVTVANPGSRHDLLIDLYAPLAAGAEPAGWQLAVRLVPDRLILAAGAFARYAAGLGRLAADGNAALVDPVPPAAAGISGSGSGTDIVTADPMTEWPGAEALAVAVLDDLANELVPRWVQVSLQRRTPPRYRVVVEDRQPNWHNPGLIARLRPL